MTDPRFHFLHDPRKPESAALAQSLLDAFGQNAADTADIIVTVGGDGLLLEGLRMAQGKRVYGITPATSNSRGFWTDHSVNSPDDLLACIASAHELELRPIQADIRFANGNQISKLAFNDVAIERASGQSALLNLSVIFAQKASEPVRIMGDGFVFSTALGSTGTCRSYGGPAIDITNNVIIMTGKGIFEPRGISPVVTNASRTEFVIDFGSVTTGKRPVRIDYDGLSVLHDIDNSPIDGLRIAAAPPEAAAHLLLTSEPGARALQAMMP